MTDCCYVRPPHTKIHPSETTVLGWGLGPLMTNPTQIDKGKPAIQLDNSRVSRGQNNDHDRPTRNCTPVVGKVHQPAVDS